MIMKKNIRMTLEYDGSRYDGWQKQGNTDGFQCTVSFMQTVTHLLK